MTKYQRNLLQLLAIAVVVGSALSLVSQLLAIEVFQGSYRKYFWNAVAVSDSSM